MLKSPPQGFETIIQQHFLLKRQNTLAVVEAWLKEASKSDTSGHHASLLKLVNELKKELVKLGPSPSDSNAAASGSPGAKVSAETNSPDGRWLCFVVSKNLSAALSLQINQRWIRR